MDAKMAWRNIWRNPRRTVLTVLAIAFACILLVFMLSFQFGSYDTMINASVKIHTGHLQIQARGYQADRKMRQVVADPAPAAAVLAAIEQVEAFTSRANTFALVSSKDRTYGVMVVGIDPVREAQVSTLARLIRKGQYLSGKSAADGMPRALIGSLLARNLHVTVGDEITVLGQGLDGSVAATVCRIRGIYTSGMDEFDRRAIQIRLEDFQQVFSMDRAVHEIVAVTRRLGDVGAIQKKARAGLAADADTAGLVALSWPQLVPGLRQAIQMDLISGAIFYLILIMVVAFSILNTFLMAIFERTREFGVMMAVGTRPGRLTRLVLAESAAMTLIGVTLGIVFGCLITWYFQVHGVSLAQSADILRQFGISGRIHPRLTLLSATIGPAVVLVITLVSALYPAAKIRRLTPVAAMSHV